ncbi:hypothetical protein Hamer_G001791 [Homarus americanus]|uniref:Uncharacterized protein n=1 Tax=Homarus americanus TaxID=6706 RepID=A0A8J5JMS7_HOMAM|nr:hypothetical protein Hamer_G001791 [Homarus americanus]
MSKQMATPEHHQITPRYIPESLKKAYTPGSRLPTLGLERLAPSRRTIATTRGFWKDSVSRTLTRHDAHTPSGEEPLPKSSLTRTWRHFFREASRAFLKVTTPLCKDREVTRSTD